MSSLGYTLFTIQFICSYIYLIIKNIFISGSLRTSATLDLETKGHYWLTVCAQDQAVVPLHSCVQVSNKIFNLCC